MRPHTPCTLYPRATLRPREGFSQTASSPAREEAPACSLSPRPAGGRQLTPEPAFRWFTVEGGGPPPRGSVCAGAGPAMVSPRPCPDSALGDTRVTPAGHPQTPPCPRTTCRASPTALHAAFSTFPPQIHTPCVGTLAPALFRINNHLGLKFEPSYKP